MCAFAFEVYTLVAADFLDVLVTGMTVIFNLIFIRGLYHAVLPSPQERLETSCRRDNTSYLLVNSNSPQMGKASPAVGEAGGCIPTYGSRMRLSHSGD